MKLILFDIDGTIIKTGANKVHYDAFSYAFDKVFGITGSIDVINFSGKIDSQISIEVLEQYGISQKASLSKLPEIFEAMISYYLKNAPKLHEHVLPNVRECLEVLSKKEDIIVGLLTGNLEEIAWEKMKQSGLKEYFKMGAFGNEALKRSDLVTVALRKTKDSNTTASNTYIIGDTPLDIDCAKEAGCKSIAAATGKFSLEELKKDEPDFLTDDILDVIKFL